MGEHIAVLCAGFLLLLSATYGEVNGSTGSLKKIFQSHSVTSSTTELESVKSEYQSTFPLMLPFSQNNFEIIHPKQLSG